MRHGKFQAPRRRISPAIWVVLILAVLGISIGGVRAYLSYSAGEVNNLFTADMNPTVTVGKDYKVKVTADYAVYLRAAIVVNWKSGSGKLLAVQPEGYSLTPGEGWVKHKDGFYYYRKAVNKGDEIPPVVQTVAPPGEDSQYYKEDYTLVANVAVQAIQALGTTDTGNTPAVTAAWGIPVITEGAQKGELQLP